MKIAFEPLRRGHDRASFSSGAEPLDEWFRKRAFQDERRNVARTFVAVNRDAANTIVGFYSLSAHTLALKSLPQDLGHRLPRYDAIPASLIGRLARSETVRGQGVGELLLADAIDRILRVGESLAVYAILVDAKTAAAQAFYQSFGFLQFPQAPRRLFLLTSTARAARSLAERR